MKENNGIAFDPGFSQYVYAFEETLSYLYQDISRFKNFSQKKMKFMQYYKKILDIFYNNIGFYTGCLLWATYIKSLPEQKITDNPYLGSEYDEELETTRTHFLQKFLLTFPKDMKYYLGKDYSFDDNIEKLIKAYEEFIIINRGFTISEKNTDINLPANINKSKLEEYNNIIKDAISKGDLSTLKEQINVILT